MAPEPIKILVLYTYTCTYNLYVHIIVNGGKLILNLLLYEFNVVLKTMNSLYHAYSFVQKIVDMIKNTSTHTFQILKHVAQLFSRNAELPVCMGVLFLPTFEITT